MKIFVNSDRKTLASQEPNDREILVRITAGKATAETAPPLRLAFALDCSGSMEGSRIDFAKRAILKALELLGPEDSAALTTFSYEAKTVVGLTNTDSFGKTKIAEKLEKINADGGTNLFDGWDLATESFNENSKDISRVLLLSDGQANVGECRIGTISRWVARASSRGIRTSVLGVGHDYDDDLLQEISAAGHGNFYYAADKHQIPKFVAQEVAESRQIVARNVILKLELPPGADLKVIGDWGVSSKDRVTTIQLPDLVADQIIELAIILRFPALADKEAVRVGFDLSTDGGPTESSELFYALGDTTGQIRDKTLFATVANLRLQQAIRDAVRLNRTGLKESAGNLFDELTLEFHAAGIDPDEFKELFKSLKNYSERMRIDLMESDRKMMSHTSTSTLRSRFNSAPRRNTDLF